MKDLATIAVTRKLKEAAYSPPGSANFSLPDSDVMHYMATTDTCSIWNLGRCVIHTVSEAQGMPVTTESLLTKGAPVFKKCLIQSWPYLFVHQNVILYNGPLKRSPARNKTLP